MIIIIIIIMIRIIDITIIIIIVCVFMFTRLYVCRLRVCFLWRPFTLSLEGFYCIVVCHCCVHVL